MQKVNSIWKGKSKSYRWAQPDTIYSCLANFGLMMGLNIAGDGSIPTTKKTKLKSENKTAHLRGRGQELLQVPGLQSRKIICLIL
jgi:hypothetical protein